MRASVRAAWIRFTEPLEGGVPCLYADVRGLITIAYGNLVDPLSAALGLPFVCEDGRAASREAITSAWLAVKGDPRCATLGHRYAAHLTTIRLTLAGMHDLALGKLATNDRILAARVAGWEDQPACAQMALHSIAWACGPHAHFPRLFEALSDGDYGRAVVESHINEITPEGTRNAGLVPRNRANAILLRNAAHVRDYGLDPDMIDWEHDLATVDPSADTLPAPLEGAVEPIVVVHEMPDMVAEAQRRDE